jgi:hypothetical protein
MTEEDMNQDWKDGGKRWEGFFAVSFLFNLFAHLFHTNSPPTPAASTCPKPCRLSMTEEDMNQD